MKTLQMTFGKPPKSCDIAFYEEKDGVILAFNAERDGSRINYYTDLSRDDCLQIAEFLAGLHGHLVIPNHETAQKGGS